MHADPKSVQIQSSSQYIFVILGSVPVKALSKILMKLTTGRPLRRRPNHCRRRQPDHRPGKSNLM